MASPDPHEQFMRLFLQHEPQILRLVLVYIPRQADARDVVQETAIALWKHFSDYDAARPFGSWAGGFARMEVRRFLRKAHRQAYLHEQAVTSLMAIEATSPLFDEQRDRHLAECRAQLPLEQRRVLEAYYVEEAAVEAIAQRHGRTIEAIYKVLQRTRSMLLECIDRKMARNQA